MTMTAVLDDAEVGFGAAVGDALPAFETPNDLNVMPSPGPPPPFKPIPQDGPFQGGRLKWLLSDLVPLR